MKTRLIFVAVVLLGLVATPAMASMFPTYSPTFGPGSGETDLQTILDNITTTPAGDSSVDVANDAILDSYDSNWEITASSGSVATFIIEITANASTNVFGLYDPTNLAEKAVIFNGAAGAGTTATVKIATGGVVLVDGVDSGVTLSSNSFGFYIGGSVGPFYSDSSLNAGGADQMLAYQGPGGDEVLLPGAGFPGEWTDNEFVLAWEDVLFPNGDGDYNDLVLMIESVQPIPVPGAVLLGVLGLSAAGIKLRRYA